MSKIHLRFPDPLSLSQAFALLLLTALTSADLLKNPGFESPPPGLPEPATPFAALSPANQTLPGWTFNGTVDYVTSGSAAGGHAVRLGKDGMINQTFVAAGDLTDYLLTFSFAVVGDAAECTASADLVVSADDSAGVFSFEKKYGKGDWQSYGHYLGAWGDGESVNLVLRSQSLKSNSTSVCWPVIDAFILKSMPKSTVPNDGNLLLNIGFELGPEFPSNSSEGILLNPSPSPLQSPLLDWSMLGTVRYINSDHFLVPQGKAAVEIIVSGASAGIQTAVQLVEGSTYTLNFTLGDANNSCTGDFVVGAQVGPNTQNFTLSSSGVGSPKNFSMTFEANVSATTIGFVSYTASQTKDGILCGPVVDDVVLRGLSTTSPSTAVRLANLWLMCLVYLLSVALIL